MRLFNSAEDLLLPDLPSDKLEFANAEIPGLHLRYLQYFQMTIHFSCNLEEWECRVK